MNPAYLNWLQQNITTVPIPQQMALLDLTGNIVNEIKAMLGWEEKRRKSESQLKVAEEKHAVKKGRVEKRKHAKQSIPTDPYHFLLRSSSPKPSSQSLPSSQPSPNDESEPTPGTSGQ